MNKQFFSKIAFVFRVLGLLLVCLGLIDCVLAQLQKNSFFFTEYELFYNLSGAGTLLVICSCITETFLRISKVTAETPIILSRLFSGIALSIFSTIIAIFILQDIRFEQLSMLITCIGIIYSSSFVPKLNDKIIEINCEIKYDD